MQGGQGGWGGVHHTPRVRFGWEGDTNTKPTV
jgi:hypothetical protein